MTNLTAIQTCDDCRKNVLLCECGDTQEEMSTHDYERLENQ